MIFSLRIYIVYIAAITLMTFSVTSKTLSFAAEDRSHIAIYVNSGLNYSITVMLIDAQGHRAGLLSVPADMLVPEPFPGSVTEIPESSVGYDSIDDHLTGKPQTGTFGIDINWPNKGNYTLELTGTVLTTYWLRIGMDDAASTSFDFDFKGVIDRGVKSTFEMVYSPTPGVTTTVARVVTFASAQQDVELSFKIDWIKNVGLKNSLIKKLQNAEADQGRGDTKAAKNTLNAFINEIKAQSGNGIDPDAATMLTQDAQYLIDHLV